MQTSVPIHTPVIKTNTLRSLMRDKLPLFISDLSFDCLVVFLILTLWAASLHESKLVVNSPDFDTCCIHTWDQLDITQALNCGAGV